jgi:hypothetical protein
MTLAGLIAELETRDPLAVVPLGFRNPHSSRACYSEVAFEPAANVTVGEMLQEARAAVGATYDGWKGGEFLMGLDTQVHLAPPSRSGEELGAHLLACMLRFCPPRDAPQSDAVKLALAVLAGQEDAAFALADEVQAAHRGPEPLPVPGWLVLNACRYALGRTTYAVGETVAWLVKHWGRVPQEARRVIARDMAREFASDDESRAAGGSYHPLGMDPHRREWQKVLDLCRKDAGGRP